MVPIGNTRPLDIHQLSRSRQCRPSVSHGAAAGDSVNGIRNGHPCLRGPQARARARHGEDSNCEFHRFYKRSARALKKVSFPSDYVNMARLGCIILAAVLAGNVTAQVIRLKTRDFTPPPDRSRYSGVPLLRRNAQTSHFLVQFNIPVRPDMFTRLRARGLSVTAYIPQSALMIAAPDDFSLEGLPVRWIGRL